MHILAVTFALTALSTSFAIVVAIFICIDINHFYDNTIHELRDIKALTNAAWRKIGPNFTRCP
ncbi:hypothetical protein OSTOST_07709 [Ostertagia ostertagi]